MTRPAPFERAEPPVWLPIAASLPVGLCMMVLSLPSISDTSADWRRLLCLALYLTLCIPLLFVQRALWRRQCPWWLLAVTLLVISYVLAISSNAVDFFVSRSLGWIPISRFEPSRIVHGIDAFWLALIAFCALHAVVSYYAELGQEKARAAAATTLAREAELRALRYQLHPHFLFNTLNAVSSLVASERFDDALQMISRLADFLRATLDQKIQHEVALADEIALTETYLAIEKARLADRLQLRWHVGPDVLGKCVPYLLLQPLVENAIRHGIALRNQPGKLVIALTQSTDMLHVCVHNDGVPASLRTDSGEASSMLGLRNISERLSKLYGANHRLSIVGNEDGGYRVEIDLPLREFSGSANHWEAHS